MFLLPATIHNVKAATSIITTTNTTTTILIIILLLFALVNCQREDSWYEELPNPGMTLTELNSTAVKLTCHECLSSVATQALQDSFGIKFSYHLILADIIHFQTRISCGQRIHPTSQSVDNDIEVCKGRLNLFGTYNDSLNKDYSYLFDYCKPHEVHLTPRNGTTDLIINGLLPHLPYKFSYKLEYRGEALPHLSEENFLKIFCMNDSAPLYAPQTDIGGFKINLHSRVINGNNSNAYRSVELYWRPVPNILAGSDDLSYEVSCLNESNTIVYNSTFSDKRRGMVEVNQVFLSNASYQCNLLSRNHLGQSMTTSPIMIPKQSSIIDTQGKFNLYVAGVTNSEYLLKWTDIEKLLPNQDFVKSSNKTQSNHYTIYWCLPSSQNGGCAYIEGMMRTTNTTTALVIPGNHSPQNRIFGISYRMNGNKNFTGLIWADCVSAVRSQAQTAYDSLDILKAVGVQNNPDSLFINWAIRGCKSMIAIIDRYELTYCHAGPVDPCTPAVLPTAGRNKNDYEFDNNSNCSTLYVPNNLVSETILKNLSASAMYAIRVRQIVDNEASNCPWSKTIFGQTLPDPAKTKDCTTQRQRPILLFFIFIIALVTVAIIYVPALRVVRHYWKMIFQYRHTNSGVTQRVEDMLSKGDNISDMGLKYWINRFPSQNGNLSNSESSLNFCSADTDDGQATKIFSDGDDYVQLQPSMPDYHSQTGRTALGSTSESIKDETRDPLSDTEDISVTSHSSFLDNILNADTDSNNIS